MKQNSTEKSIDLINDFFRFWYCYFDIIYQFITFSNLIFKIFILHIRAINHRKI